MVKRIVSAVILTLFLASIPTLAFSLPSGRDRFQKIASRTQSTVGTITDPVGDVTVGDATSASFDITKVSFSINNSNLMIEFEVNGAIAQGGYFVLFDTDQNTSTGCSGYTEIDSFIGTDYFIHFNPINVPAAQLCSSYRPWVLVKELRYNLSGSAVTFYLDVSGIGFSDDSIRFDVVASTFLHSDGTIYRDRAPDTAVFTVTTSCIPAQVDIRPRSLTLKSRGRWIMAFIELPEGYDVSDVNVSTVMLNHTIQTESRKKVIGDYDNDGIPDLMVKFDRAKVISYILTNLKSARLCRPRFACITLTITGYINDGTLFEGSDSIRAIYTRRACCPR